MPAATATPNNHYINNKEFLAAMIEYRNSVLAWKAHDGHPGQGEKPRVPEYIGSCLIKIATGLSHKYNFINYTFREEMVLDAIENALTYIDNFDPAKSSNPFAYFTQISYYAFVRRITREKRHQDTKNNFVTSLDLDNIIAQGSDDGDYANSFISFLKRQIDIANKDSEPKDATPKPTRKPKYLQKKKVVEEVGILPLD
jgi:DNA-directed RNA polymerase specialized sigma24 family protein